MLLILALALLPVLAHVRAEHRRLLEQLRTNPSAIPTKVYQTEAPSCDLSFAFCQIET